MILDSQHNEGFEVFDRVFSNSEIVELRRIAIDLLPSNSPPFRAKVEGNIFDKSEELTRLVLGNKDLQSAIVKVHGPDFLLLDESALHDSFFGGWHTDTTTPESYGYQFHQSENFHCVQWAVYLQDNSVYGGGLSAKSGTHKLQDPFVRDTLKNRNYSSYYKTLRSIGATLRRLLHNNKRNSACPFAIPTKIGDVVAFNLKIQHRATPYQIPPTENSNRKLAIFFVTGSKCRESLDYRDWIHTYHSDKKDGSRNISPNFLKFCESQDIEFMP